MPSLRVYHLLLCFMIAVFALSSCSKDDDDMGGGGNNNENNQTKEKDLVIKNGALNVDPEASVQYEAYLVNKEGNQEQPNSLEWSSSDGQVASISSNGAVNIQGTGQTTISAKAVHNETEYEASVPLGISQPAVFSVVPSAIVWSTGAGDIELTPVYFGSGSTDYSYESSDQSVVTVNSNGKVSFEGAGNCNILVTAEGLDGQPTVTVPVHVKGEPQADLPITRIEITPQSANMFREETQAFTAKAYNANGEEQNADFSWRVTENEIGNVDQNGSFTAHSIGKAKVQAEAKGIIGEAEVLVHPDTFLMLDPMNATVSAGASQTFEVSAYKVNRSDRSLESIAQPNNITWETPSYGIPMLDIASVDQNGKVTIEQDASPGLTTVVMARVENKQTIQPGIANVIVGSGMGGNDCDCGNGHPDVENINASPDPLTISMSSGGTGQIDASAVDANGDEVSEANLVYCSQDQNVATVDSEGMVMGASTGETTITICNGDVETTINVEVSI